ncbi:uncharacterized protein LOC130630426 [Hydractinia symbiolongicarpus]|uniref:uncharacterized protein LOC130630426 n=1 Tax=Hydractinia symbiolongicarpus TaxID=13093 RepID=UPI00254DD26D|nr:uncharacterized protein LOC130630426 [Hydractinia symbiolongicarpus]
MMFIFLKLLVVAFLITLVVGDLYTPDDELPKGGITKYLKGETEVSCLLQCERDQQCDNAMFKSKNKQMRRGDCWFVKMNATDQGEEMQMLKTDEAITSYKKVLPKCPQDEWTLLKRNVCFGARPKEYGEFKVQYDAVIKSIKLVHVGGIGVKCVDYRPATKWGCRVNEIPPFGEENIAVVITDKQNKLLYPDTAYHKGAGFFFLPGYNSTSAYLILPGPSEIIHKGQELRLHFSEDLYELDASDNSGESCADIYAKLCAT